MNSLLKILIQRDLNAREQPARVAVAFHHPGEAGAFPQRMAQRVFQMVCLEGVDGKPAHMEFLPH
jgi:hypothetical protein